MHEKTHTHTGTQEGTQDNTDKCLRRSKIQTRTTDTSNKQTKAHRRTRTSKHNKVRQQDQSDQRVAVPNDDENLAVGYLIGTESGFPPFWTTAPPHPIVLAAVQANSDGLDVKELSYSLTSCLLTRDALSRLSASHNISRGSRSTFDAKATQRIV